MLSLQHISKSSNGNKILKDINLAIPLGKMVGLLGPNGSGKSTLLKLICRIVKPTKGIIQFEEKPLIEKSLSQISVFLEGNTFPPWMKINDTAYFYQKSFLDFDAEKYHKLIEAFSIDPMEKIANQSKGNLTKIKLILALSRKAKLFLLDEPLDGLDFLSRQKCLDLIIDAFTEECSMIFSSHFVKELERLFTVVIFLQEGKIRLMGDAEDLRIEYGKSINEIYQEIYRPCCLYWSMNSEAVGAAI